MPTKSNNIGGRGGKRPGAGRKKKALTEKVESGNPGGRTLNVLDIPDVSGVDMPKPHDFLSSGAEATETGSRFRGGMRSKEKPPAPPKPANMLFPLLFTGKWPVSACVLLAFVEMANSSGKSGRVSLFPPPALALSKPAIEKPKPAIEKSMRRIERRGGELHKY